MPSKPVENWEQILRNVDDFCEGIKFEDSFTHKHFGQFYHWYYFPNENRFAPNKFIGYEGTTLKNYKGDGNGGVAKKALSKFFDQVNPNDRKYAEYKNGLEKFAKSINCAISKRIDYAGGIYIPKKEYYDLKISQSDAFFLEDVKDVSIKEGRKYYGYSSHYERSWKLRQIAVETKGLKCTVCGFDFEAKYGDRGRGYIEVHHIFPLSKYSSEKEVNPLTDLEVLCSNCHRMIHRLKNKVLTIKDLKELVRGNRYVK
jgi:5-methylcytosine-specific restriction enzyme A